MTLKILLFGPQAMLAGRQEVVLEVSDTPVSASEVLNLIGKELPQLSSSLGNSRLAIDHEFADPKQIVPFDSEVALIGMVSGG